MAPPSPSPSQPVRSVSPEDCPEESAISFRVSAQVTTHVMTAAARGKKAKDKKDTKTKEFIHKFRVTPEAYILLLQTILDKHGQDKYKVTAKRRYNIKVLCSPARA